MHFPIWRLLFASQIVSARQILESLEQTGKISSNMSKYTIENNILMQHLAYKLQHTTLK